MSSSQARAPIAAVVNQLLSTLRQQTGFCLCFVEVSHVDHQQELLAALQAQVPATLAIEISASAYDPSENLAAQLKDMALDASQQQVLFFKQLDTYFKQPERDLSLVGWLNDQIANLQVDHPHLWVIPLPQEAIDHIMKNAPDLALAHHDIYVLEESPAQKKAAFVLRYEAAVRLYLETMLPEQEVSDALVSQELDKVFEALEEYDGGEIPRFWVLQVIAQEIDMDDFFQYQDDITDFVVDSDKLNVFFEKEPGNQHYPRSQMGKCMDTARILVEKHQLILKEESAKWCSTMLFPMEVTGQLTDPDLLQLALGDDQGDLGLMAADLRQRLPLMKRKTIQFGVMKSLRGWQSPH